MNEPVARMLSGYKEIARKIRSLTPGNLNSRTSMKTKNALHYLKQKVEKDHVAISLERPLENDECRLCFSELAN
jgi:hypothetical protein